MNHAIILSGGVGQRMGSEIPKQYIRIKGIPVIIYTCRKLASHPAISTIAIALADEWRSFMKEELENEPFKDKIIYCQGGKSRQHSILNGLAALRPYAQDNDCIVIHDAVRPLFPRRNIDEGINACTHFDGAVPVIRVKDTTYLSTTGYSLDEILPREQLYSGQTPETFIYKKYLDAHASFCDKELCNIRGTSELAFKAGLSVGFIPGTESNIKLTTPEDLLAIEQLLV